MNIKGYERALELLEKEKFKEAGNAFEKLMNKTDNLQFREKCRSNLLYCGRKLKETKTKEAFDPGVKAVFLINEKQFDESITLLQPLLKKEPKNDILLFTMAIAYAGKGDKKKSMELLKKAIILNPANRLHALQEENLSELTDKLSAM